MYFTIEDQKWEQACEKAHKIINNALLMDLNWKLKIRYFKTPSYIVKI